MKKIFSIVIALILAFSCMAVTASSPSKTAAVSDDVGLSLFPSSMLLPMFSSSSGERLRVLYDGELVPADLFRWESSDPGVVTVTQDGRLHAVAPGSAVIRAYEDDDEYAESVITVVDDEATATLADLEPIELDLPFYSDEVGIGPLCGAEPVVLKRMIVPPSCGDVPEPDPNAFIASNGWTYSYAVIYKFRVHYGQSFRFVTSASTAPSPHASGAYVCVYDRYFYLWEYDRGTALNPYGCVTLDTYEESDFYLVITPIDHTDDAGSGNICLYAYDIEHPYAQGDVDMDHYVTSSDALTALRSALGIITLDESAAALADCNSDGSVGSEDALMILRAALGIL